MPIFPRALFPALSPVFPGGLPEKDDPNEKFGHEFHQQHYTNDLFNSIRLENMPGLGYIGSPLIEIRKDALVSTREALAAAPDIMGKADIRLTESCFYSDIADHAKPGIIGYGA
jgi:hypothetical protein